MKEREPVFHEDWPADFNMTLFHAGDKVTYRGEEAHVIAARVDSIPKGEVPIALDDGSVEMSVPADDLHKIEDKESWE